MLILITEVLGLEKKYRSDNELNLLSLGARPSGGKLKQGNYLPLITSLCFLNVLQKLLACLLFYFDFLFDFIHSYLSFSSSILMTKSKPVEIYEGQ